jgi:MFS family permease
MQADTQVNDQAEVEAERQRIYKRTLVIVAISQILSGLGLAAGVTVGALLAQDMLGSTGLAGLPNALLTLGSASAAMLVGRLSQRHGRRAGLSAGYLAGAVGGAGVVVAAVVNSPVLLFLCLFVYGSGMSTSLLARYAGTDLALPERRGQAVSTVLVATTFGAVIGPNMVGPMSGVAAAIGIPELAGPFLLATSAYGLAALVLTILLRPDPLIVARRVARATAQAAGRAIGETVIGRNGRGIALGASVMVVANIVMIAVMTMTPIHMRHHGHGLGATGLVIAVHVAGMFLFSPITGYLVDRAGRIPLMIASCVTLLASGAMAAYAPVESVAILALALGLLGLGWNFGLVSGTAMITDSTPLETRASTQGTVDVCVALSGAGGGALSGVVVATSSYAVLALAGGALALALIPLIVLAQAAQAAARGSQAGA